MKRAIVFSVALLLFGVTTKSQTLSISELKEITKMKSEQIDTLMKRKKFRLLEKDTDSVSNLVYYNSVEKTPEGATWVRSLTYIDAVIKNRQGRLVTYRTYRKKEYQEMMGWLLRNNFHTASRSEMDKRTVTKYSNGKEEIIFKVTKQKLPSGTMVLSYEVEIGE